MDMETKGVSTFTLASPWALSPSARQKLLQTFKSHLQGSKVDFIAQNQKEECVSLRCTEECFVSFVQFASTFYKAELGAYRDVFDSPEIRRLSGTSAMTTFSPPLSPPSQTKRIQSEGPHNNLIDHESQCGHWAPSQQETQSHTRLHIPSNALAKLETICSVRIIDSQGTLTILADTREVIARAIQKLNVIQDTLAYHTFTQDHLVLEGEISCEIRMVALKDIPDSRLKTTLLSPRSSYYKSLTGCRVVALVKDGAVYQIRPSVHSNEDATYLWQGHQLSMQAASQDVSNATEKSTISRWIVTSNAAPIMDPFAPGHDVPSSIILRNRPSFPTLRSENVSTKKVRKIKGAMETSQPARAPPVATSQVQPNTSPDFTKLTEAQFVVKSCKAGQPKSQQLAAEEHPHQPPRDYFAQEPPCSSHATWQRNAKVLNHQPPAITGPFMPPTSIMPLTIDQVASREWEHSPVLPENNADVLVEAQRTSTCNTNQRVQKTKKHNTMNQRKPQTVAENTAYVKEVERTFLDMLRSAVSRPATQLHVVIGRILIDRSTIQHDFRRNVFDVKGWAYATNGLRTEFTQMLTSKYTDATEILNMRLSQGRRLFVAATLHRKVVYSIQCQTRSNECMLIEVEENKQFKIHGSRFVNGAVNWHFVKRAWDAQLVLSSEEFMGGDYIHQVQSLVDSIEITRSQCGNELVLSFSGNCIDFQIQSMFLQRETVHNSTMYPDLLLHLTEVQDLDVRPDKDDPDYYLGTIQVQDAMVDNHRLWWETSITSKHVSDILETSAELELGEKAPWKPEEIIEIGVVADMYALAQEVVTRIDHVGIENKGHATSESRSTMKPASYELPTGPAGYW